MSLELGPAWTRDVDSENRAATANHLDHNIGVECPYFFVPYIPLLLL